METIMSLLFVGFAIFSIFSIISHFNNHGKLKTHHVSVMAELEPVRSINSMEIEKFKEFFKKDLPITTKIFKHRGIVDYISIEVNHTENREYTIGGVRIHPISSRKLSMKKIGFKLEEYLPDLDSLKPELELYTENLESEDISEELEQKLLKLKDKHFSHDFEFIFLKEDNVQSQAAYILSFDEWILAKC